MVIAMVDLTSIRTILDNKIWNSDISRTVSVHNISSSTVDDYGQPFITYDAGTSAKAVPYNTFSFQRDQLAWGLPDEGMTDMAFRYDAPLAKGGIVVDATQTTASYYVVDIEDYKFGDGSVALIARLSKPF